MRAKQPGQGLLYNLLTLSSLIHLFIAKMVRYGALSHAIDYVNQVLNILNLKGYTNCVSGSKVASVASVRVFA